MDIVIRVCLLGGALVAEIYCVVIGIGIIAEERREKNKRNRQADKPLGKTRNLVRLLLSFFSKNDVKSGDVGGLVNLNGGSRLGVRWRHPLQIFNNLVRFRIHKNAAKPPNEKS